MSKSLAVRVLLLVGDFSDDDHEPAIEVMRETTSLWSGGDFADSAAAQLFEKCAGEVEKTIKAVS